MSDLSVKLSLSILLLFVSSLTFAEVVLEVVTEDLKPYNYMENGEIKGGATDIVKKMLERSGIKYKIKVYPWARAYNMALKKPNVLIYTMIKIAPREKLFKWIRPLGSGGSTSLYRLKESHFTSPKTIESAKKYTIGTVNNSMDHIWLKNNGFTRLKNITRVEQLVSMFFAKRFELMAIDETSIDGAYKSLGFERAETTPVLFLFDTPPFMALSRSTSDEVLIRLQKAYDELLRDNQIKLVN